MATPPARRRRSESIVAERQAPLRARYAESPPAALTRKSARTSSARVAAGDPFHGEVEVGDGYGVALRFGLDRQIGGLHDAPNPGDLLCAALAACEDGTVRMIANLLGIELDELEVEVTGELDVRGCLGADADVAVGFAALECAVRLVAAPGTDPQQLEALVSAAERFCVNLDTLRRGTDVATGARVEIAGRGSGPAQGELWGAEASDWAGLQEPQHRRLHEHALHRTGIGADVSLLDLGCGSGALCRLAADAGARVRGLDAAVPLLEIARERVPEGRFDVGDLQFLPYADDCVDVVTAINSIQYAADPQAAIREAGRVTREGGTIFILVWGREEHTELSAMLRALGPLLPPAPEGAPGPFALSAAGTLEELAEKAGLTPADAGYLPATFEYADGDTMVRALTSGGPGVLASRTSGRDAVRDAMSAAFAACRTAAGGYRIESEWRYLTASPSP